jgi:hypothetical protein
MHHWEPRSRTRIELSQWQELKAYGDAKSNHFDFTYRLEQRDTNRALYAYDDQSISVGLSLIF